MHIVEEKQTVPGLGYQKVPEGLESKTARVTVHPAAMTWWRHLTSQERGEIVRAAWEAAGEPTPAKKL